MLNPAQNLADDLSSIEVADVSVKLTYIGGDYYFRVVREPFSGKNAKARQEMIDRGSDDAWRAKHEGIVKNLGAKVAAKKAASEKTTGKKEKISKVEMTSSERKMKTPVAY